MAKVHGCRYWVASCETRFSGVGAAFVGVGSSHVASMRALRHVPGDLVLVGRDWPNDKTPRCADAFASPDSDAGKANGHAFRPHDGALAADLARLAFVVAKVLAEALKFVFHRLAALK